MKKLYTVETFAAWLRAMGLSVSTRGFELWVAKRNEERRRDVQREEREARKRAGRCIQGACKLDARPGKTRCPEHARANAKRMRDLFHRRYPGKPLERVCSKCWQSGHNRRTCMGQGNGHPLPHLPDDGSE